MATEKPRINMALRREYYDVVTRLAKLQKRSRSAVVVELLEAAIPVLERVVVAGEAAQRAQSTAREELRSSLEKAEAAILPHVNAAMGQLDAFLVDSLETPLVDTARGAPSAARTERSEVAPRRGRPTALKRARGPRPVTRGPGRGSRTGKARAAKGRKTQ